MNKYTIKYWYGSYSGTLIIWADDEDTAIVKMWAALKRHMSLPMAYKAAEIIKVETSE